MSRACSRPSRGFTLIELLVTISVAVVLMTIAVPNFVQFQRNSQLTTTSNTLLAAVSAARGEAMKRGANAMVRPLTDNDWSKGWRIYVDVNRDNVWSDGTDIQVSVGAPLPSYISVNADGTAAEASPYLLFDASGYA
ncbi:MAG TPA: GspH/FimT family pseudopilin, partial [Burkholderiaceae bacterium]|nr:GspH/FimT family pseudopilin [Burkholderiaceae bacterium]